MADATGFAGGLASGLAQGYQTGIAGNRVNVEAELQDAKLKAAAVQQQRQMLVNDLNGLEKIITETAKLDPGKAVQLVNGLEASGTIPSLNRQLAAFGVPGDVKQRFLALAQTGQTAQEAGQRAGIIQGTTAVAAQPGQSQAVLAGAPAAGIAAAATEAARVTALANTDTAKKLGEMEGAKTLAAQPAQTQAKVNETKTLAGPQAEAAALKVGKTAAATAAATPQSDIGKMVSDRGVFVRQFGEGSPQVKLYDEAFSQKTGGVKQSDIHNIRKEFTQLSTPYMTARDAYSRVVASAANPSPAGDLALIFNYMKVLDPGSVVRESEFAQAASTGAFGERIQAAVNRVINGERLSDTIRADFLNRSEALFQAQINNQVKLESQYQGIADRAGIKNQGDVVVDLIGDYRRHSTVGKAGDRRIRADLNGNLIK